MKIHITHSRPGQPGNHVCHPFHNLIYPFHYIDQTTRRKRREIQKQQKHTSAYKKRQNNPYRNIGQNEIERQAMKIPGRQSTGADHGRNANTQPVACNTDRPCHITLHKQSKRKHQNSGNCGKRQLETGGKQCHRVKQQNQQCCQAKVIE